MGKEQQGQQLVFSDAEMQEAARASFLKQSLVKILSNSEKHEAQSSPSFSIIRKRGLHSKEPFVVGYLTTDACIVNEADTESEDNEQVVAFVHSRSSDEVLIITKGADNAKSQSDFENQDVKMFILPWPPIEPNKGAKQIIDMVKFLIDFTETVSAWDELESNIPSVQDFIRDSFIEQGDLDNLKFSK